MIAPKNPRTIERFYKEQIDALKAENAALHAECDRLTAMMGTGSLSEQKTNHAFLGGICVALQAITATDNGVLWSDIVSACGPEKISHYAKTIEPDEWEIAGFSKYYKRFYKDEVANKMPEVQG